MAQSSEPALNLANYSSLSRLMARLQAVLEPAIDKSFWLRAEVGSANERDGVMYCELVETQRGTVIAKLRCTIWSQDLRRIRATFQRAGLELALQHGSVVGLQCCVQFHKVHGLSLKVLDMDPAFALGELALKRQRILESLERADLLRRNAQCVVPLLPNRIVLVTSSSGAAYHDFMRTLQARDRFGIRVWLADAMMQGSETEGSVLTALSVAERLPADLVVLIRGGGSRTDLSWLDSEPIARRIAMLRLPVWTGIGHETDESVLDAVAAQSFRTPTAVAEALVARFEQVVTQLEHATQRLHRTFFTAQRAQRERLDRDSVGLRQGSRKLLALRNAQLTGDANKLRVRVSERLANARSVWVGRSHRMRQSIQARFGTAQRDLDRAHNALTANGRRSLEAQTSRLRDALARLPRIRLSERFAAEHVQVERQRTALQRSSQQHVASASSRLGTLSSGLHSFVMRRLSTSHRALLPRAARLRGAVALRTGTATARLDGLRERLAGAAGRKLQRTAQDLRQTEQRLSLPRVLARCEREGARLVERERVLLANDPRMALARGFSLTYSAAGNLLRSISAAASGEVIVTQLADGRIESTIRQIDGDLTDERKD